MSKNSLTWRDVIDGHKIFGLGRWVNQLWKVEKAGYKYFSINGFVFEIVPSDDDGLYYKQLGTLEDFGMEDES